MSTRSLAFSRRELVCRISAAGKTRRAASLHVFVLLLLATVLALTPWVTAQSGPAEHMFQVPKAELDKALLDLHIATPGRLPTLDGFVAADVPMLEKYQRGYYQYKVEVRPTSGGAILRVSAKVTAWYTGGGTVEAGYRELRSNGRLETDLIERLEAALQPSSPSVADQGNAAPQAIPAKRPAEASKQKPSDSSVFHPPLPSEALGARSALTAPSVQEIAEQRRVRQLSEQTSNLEEVLRNQAHPDDLAAVRKTGTTVLAKPVESGDVLFRADAEDEFKVLDESNGWVHVQVSGISRGWIRRSDLEMPGEMNVAGSQSAVPAPDVHEETSLFPGDWPALRGRMVRIRWVQSSSGTAEVKGDRWQLARSAFRDTYERVTRSSIKIEGIVLVIDAADGGMIAATTSTLQRWNTGALSDAAFREGCWADPPETLAEQR